jgi:hypothetical protein
MDEAHDYAAVQPFSLQVLADNDATVASVTFSCWPGWPKRRPVTFQATGSSKRERGDSYDEEVGELLAASRALSKLAARMERRARSRMCHLDALKRHKEQVTRRKALQSLKLDATEFFFPNVSFDFRPVLSEEQVTALGGLPNAPGEFTGCWDEGAGRPAMRFSPRPVTVMFRTGEENRVARKEAESPEEAENPEARRHGDRPGENRLLPRAAQPDPPGPGRPVGHTVPGPDVLRGGGAAPSRGELPEPVHGPGLRT